MHISDVPFNSRVDSSLERCIASSEEKGELVLAQPEEKVIPVEGEVSAAFTAQARNMPEVVRQLLVRRFVVVT